ncbi:MAG: SDR family NAD(P)-dependent oxidoreductase [Pseudonocardiaceae bacterium]|nr:SDR family NAD(P)-dependent oxidoreductase [Pseudonocardiaceae bacterium]
MTIPRDLHIFREDWERAPTAPVPRAAPRGCALVFLSDARGQDAMRRRLAADYPELIVITVARGAEFRRRGEHSYEIGDECETLLRTIMDEYGSIGLIAQLWGTEDQRLLWQPDAVVTLLRTLVRRQLAPDRIVLGCSYRDTLERCAAESWIGFERSIRIVLPAGRLTTLCVDAATHPANELPALLATEIGEREPTSALYTGGHRYTQCIRPVEHESATAAAPLRSGGTYLITGGTGGLGTIFGTWLAREYRAQLVLLARGARDEDVVRRLGELEAAGATATLYCQADVCDATALSTAVDAAVDRFGRIDGVLHAAGVEQHGSIADRHPDTFNRVVAPKVAGTVNLENALAGRQPDFLCYFSSSAAVLGDFGSCDYAFGNRFQMSYARQLAKQDHSGPRRLAINWPLWNGDGMDFSDDTAKQFYLRSSGQRLLEPTEGTALFRELLGRKEPQYLALAGQPDRIRAMLRLDADSQQEAADGAAGTTSAQRLDNALRDIASRILRLPSGRLAPDESFQHFGFDSISLVEFAGVIAEQLGVEFTPDLFFSYTTLAELSAFLLERYPQQVASRYGNAAASSDHSGSDAPASHRHAESTGLGARRRTRPATRSRFATEPPPHRSSVAGGRASVEEGEDPAVAELGAASTEQIAIIGMSGRFPQAHNVDELWEILAESKRAIAPGPVDRDPSWSDGKGRHLGWIPGAAEFDPRFFEIAPSEAATMDPRQRLLLEHMWQALEDAACGPEQVAGEKVGVFVGVEEGDYRLLAAGEEGITANHNAVLAARLSYFLNLSGPCLAINTACSSSLVALHEACLSLRNGDCDTVIVAGANVMATPREYDALDGAGLLSPDGVCRAFDQRAGGLVPGEAVAAVVLRRRDRAERDGHSGYGSILASGVNNDGKTNGITAPNGKAQAALLDGVYRRAGISPESVGHIVTHGTGTRLGDPVEINSLIEAFRRYTDKTGFCALTSTKPNVGHSLAASGLVSVIALILGMRHDVIPPSIDCEQVSDFVSWERSPFYVNRERRRWPRGAAVPRRGGVSAFGFSGTNAHVVVEGHSTLAEESERLGTQPNPPCHLFVCSAKTGEALARQLRALADWLESCSTTGPGVLASVSYTLVAGRHHFSQRCAVVVRDRAEAISALREAAEGGERDGVFRGAVPRDFSTDDARARTLRELAASGHEAKRSAEKYRRLLGELAESYCQGHDAATFVPLWGQRAPERVSLPTYSFDHTDYWVLKSSRGAVARAGRGHEPWPHPLVHRNTSDVYCQRFAATFNGEERWFVGSEGSRLMSLGAQLELVRAAVVLALGSGDVPVRLCEVTCYEPVTADESGATIRIDLRANDHGVIDWALYTGDENVDRPHLVADGSAETAHVDVGSAINLPELRANCTQALDGAGRTRTDATGSSRGRVRLLIELERSADGVPEIEPEGLVLVPGQLDACLAAVRAFLGRAVGDDSVKAIAEGCFAASAAPACWAVVTLGAAEVAGERSVTVELTDSDGLVLARLGGLRLVERRGAANAALPVEQAVVDQSGAGRRPEMRGWTEHECLAWELSDAAGKVLKIPADQLDVDENLAHFGFDSLNIARFATELSTRVGLTITPDVFFNHPTLGRLSEHLRTTHADRISALYREGPARDPAVATPAPTRPEVRYHSDRFEPGTGNRSGAAGTESAAIVGMSGRFPGARSIDELWSILEEGRHVIHDVPEERRPWWSTGEQEDLTRRFGAVPGIAEFDPMFFGISPRDAELMDPRQRLLLQEMWNALENAGYAERAISDEKVGIFVGVEEGDYRYLVDERAGMTDNSNSVLAGRLAYVLNLTGPAVAVNTACSSGLVALHEACLSLRNGDCDAAIVSGASIMASAHDYIEMEKATMLSPDRTCYAFDRRANGLVPGEAVVALVLRRKGAAERDGNRIYATVLGTGINYDGRTNGITAPNGDAQAQLLGSIYDRRRIAPDTIDYVVTHGTGTRLGDPIEINALVDAFRSRTERTGFCALTSVKPNIGHTMAASGLVNLICMTTAMRKEVIPPSINCDQLSDYVDWENSPFFVNRETQLWPSDPQRRRRGAVSSFGMSGTNAHVVLEANTTEREDRELPAGEPTLPGHLLVVSAKTETALTHRLSDLADHLETHGDDGDLLASVSRTLMTGRHHFLHRCALVVQDRDDAVELLRRAAAGVQQPRLYRATVSRDFAPNSTIYRTVFDLARSGHTLRDDRGAYQDNLAALAEFYCQGYAPAFEELWDTPPRFVSLPTYPFETEEYWPPIAPALATRAHPLVREHFSDGDVRKFSTRLTGDESFLSELDLPAGRAGAAR